MDAPTTADAALTPASSSLFQMPRIGLGTWKAPKCVVGNAVKEAILAGYPMIDCAAAYDNETEIGDVLQELFNSSVIERKDLFVVSKIPNTHHVITDGCEDRPRECLLRTLKDLQLEYLDLYLMHWPIGFVEKELPGGWLRDEKGAPNPNLTIREEFMNTWKSMERLKEQGLVRNIGVSNFRQDQLESLLQGGIKFKPVVNQVELHPYLQQPELVEYCKANEIQIMAYSPLGSGDSYSGCSYPKDKGCTLLDHPMLKELANRVQKSVAQVLIRWSVQSGFVCIPKSTNRTRIAENILVFDWMLSDDDMSQIKSLDSNFRYSIGYMPGHYGSPNAPW